MKLMERMKVCASTKRLLLLCCCFIISTGQKVCDHSTPEGSSITLPLAKKGLTIDHELIWKHNDTVLVNRKRGGFSKGAKEDIDSSGSLKLTDVKKTSSGKYIAEVFDAEGQIVQNFAKTWNLCVTDRVPKPSVTHTCELDRSTVNLTCNVLQPKGLSFKWSENGKDVKETQTFLIRPVEEPETDRNFTCTVYKPGGSETSPTVTPKCTKAKGKENIVPEVSTDRVPKPLVTYTCEKKTVSPATWSITLNCSVSQGLSFKWSENGKDVKETQMTLTRPVKTGSSFTCTVYKPGGSETSTTVTPKCTKDSSIFPERLFGFEFWTMVGILASGGALLLTLIVIVCCCCRRARRRRQRKTEEERGLRLDPTNQQQQQQQQYLR